jgi:hypothetical protein
MRRRRRRERLRGESEMVSTEEKIMKMKLSLERRKNFTGTSVSEEYGCIGMKYASWSDNEDSAYRPTIGRK